MPKVLIPLAPGCEEMEAVILIDTLRRAGWEVVAASIEDGPVRCSRGVRLLADARWREVDPIEFGLLVIPGGKGGTERLMEEPAVIEAVRVFDLAGKPIAAICAGPLVLEAAGVLDGRRFTSHPSVADEFGAGQRLASPAVVQDGHIFTSQGPGTTFAFALALVAHWDGREKAEAIAGAMRLDSTTLPWQTDDMESDSTETGL